MFKILFGLPGNVVSSPLFPSFCEIIKGNLPIFIETFTYNLEVNKTATKSISISARNKDGLST